MKLIRIRRILVMTLVVVMLVNCILPACQKVVLADNLELGISEIDPSDATLFMNALKSSMNMDKLSNEGYYFLRFTLPEKVTFTNSEGNVVEVPISVDNVDSGLGIKDKNEQTFFVGLQSMTDEYTQVQSGYTGLINEEQERINKESNSGDYNDHQIIFFIDQKGVHQETLDLIEKNGFQIYVLDSTNSSEALLSDPTTPSGASPGSQSSSGTTGFNDLGDFTYESEDAAGFLEKAVSLFITTTGLGYYGLLQLIMGKGASIETLIFNQFDSTKLTLFDSMGDANTYITDMRTVLNQFFRIGTQISIICYMIILIYMGIRIFLNAGAQRKAQYKQLLMYWVQGIAILFFFPYVIKYTILVNDTFVKYVYQSKNNMTFYGNFEQPKTSVEYDDITKTPDTMKETASELNTRGESGNSDYFSVIYYKAINRGWITYAICFVVIVKQWITLLIVYFKRLITVIFLVAIFPFVSISYAIDKIGDGKSQAFNNWYKEFALNVFLQSFHVVVYVVGMSIILMASEYTNSNPNENWLLILIVIAFLSSGEEMLRGIFNMKGGGGDTVKGIGATMLAAKGATDLVKGTRQAISNRFGENSSIQKLGRFARNADSKVLDAVIAKSRNRGIDLQEKYDNSLRGTPEYEMDYTKEIETALGLNGSTASKEEQEKSLQNLYDALHSSDKTLREKTEKALVDYFNHMNASGGQGEKMAQEFDAKMAAIGTARAIASGGLTPVELNENINILLDFHKKGKISSEQIKNITGLSLAELKAMQGPNVQIGPNGKYASSKAKNSSAGGTMITPPTRAPRGGSGMPGTGRASGSSGIPGTGRASGSSGIPGTGRASGSSGIPRTGRASGSSGEYQALEGATRKVSGGNRYSGVFTAAPATVVMRGVRKDIASQNAPATTRFARKIRSGFVGRETWQERHDYNRTRKSLYRNFKTNKVNLKGATRNLQMAREGILNAKNPEELARAQKIESHFSETVTKLKREQQVLTKEMKKHNESLRDRKIKLYGPVTATIATYQQSRMEKGVAKSSEEALKTERYAKKLSIIRRVALKNEKKKAETKGSGEKEESTSPIRGKFSDSFVQKQQMESNANAFLASVAAESSYSQELTNEAGIVYHDKGGVLSRFSETITNRKLSKLASREGAKHYGDDFEEMAGVYENAKTASNDFLERARQNNLLSDRTPKSPMMETNDGKTRITGFIDTHYSPYENMNANQRLEYIQEIADKVSDSKSSDMYTLDECYGFVMEYREIRKHAKSYREKNEIDEIFKAKGINMEQYASLTGELIIENPYVLDLNSAEDVKMYYSAQRDAQANSYQGNEVAESELVRRIRTLDEDSMRLAKEREENNKALKGAARGFKENLIGVAKTAPGVALDALTLPIEMGTRVTVAGTASSNLTNSLIASGLAGNQINQLYYGMKNTGAEIGTTTGKLASELGKRLNPNRSTSANQSSNSSKGGKGNSSSQASSHGAKKKSDEFKVSKISKMLKL